MEITEASLRYESEYSGDAAILECEHSRSVFQATTIAKKILTDMMQFRRVSSPQTACVVGTCQKCLAPHLSQIVSTIEQGQPVTFVLPAFPGKSPNPAKVFGPLPDMAERCALEFLQHLCDRVRRHYSPGARIILCSDGKVFSDIVGMRDKDVTEYQEELSKMIVNLGLTSISTFNLEEEYAEICDGLSFDKMRSRLMEEYGESIDLLKASVSRGKVDECSVDDKEAHRLYCGITRFLVEDAIFPGQKKSRSALQKECRIRAYSVIQRSKAWGELVVRRFPEAVRLSIHPQSCGAKKLGIRLIDSVNGLDNWQTPWHGVAVHVSGRYMLLKRSKAEALGAHLVTRFGRPSHFILTDNEGLSRLQNGGIEHEA